MGVFRRFLLFGKRKVCGCFPFHARVVGSVILVCFFLKGEVVRRLERVWSLSAEEEGV